MAGPRGFDAPGGRRRGAVLIRGLLGAIGTAIGVFCLWGAWEMLRQTPNAPQALVPALLFAGLGGLAVVSGAATFVFRD